MILNYFNNQDTLENEELDKVDYSLIVYGPTKDKKSREVYDTFHFNNVKEDEKLLGCFAMCKDVVDNLLEHNNSKEKVKEIFNKGMALMWLNIYKYIDQNNM